MGKKLREQIFARINYCGEKSENQKWWLVKFGESICANWKIYLAECISAKNFQNFANLISLK